MRYLLLILNFIPIIVFGQSLPESAQQVSFTMEAPKIVELGEQFKLTFTLNASGQNLKLPVLSDFDVLMGPSTSQSGSFQIINGESVQSVSISYLYVLRAKKEGRFTINAASINVNGTIYTSNNLLIEVVKGSANTYTQWTNIKISGVGTMEIPPTMEVQEVLNKSVYEQYSKTRTKRTLPNIIIQPKGRNNHADSSFNRYANIQITVVILDDSTEIGLNFDYSKISQEDKKLIYDGYKKEVSNYPSNVKIFELYPLTFVKINNVNCYRVGLKRQLDYNPPVFVYLYKFFDFKKAIEISISWREKEAKYWKDDLFRSLNSFKYNPNL